MHACFMHTSMVANLITNIKLYDTVGHMPSVHDARERAFALWAV